MQERDEQLLTAVTELLEKSGHAPEQARLMAADILKRQAEVTAGCHWGGVYAEFLPKLWARASSNGDKRRLLLQITAEGDCYDEYTGHLHVEVMEAQTWAEFEAAQREAREKAVN